MDKAETLSLIRTAASKAPPPENDRVILECVEALPTCPTGYSRVNMSNVVSSLRNSDLKLLLADKEGGFVVAESKLHKQSADNAFRENFKISEGFRPAKAKNDLLLAHYDRKLQDQLASKGSIKIFRYVDDFLVLLPAKLEDAPAEVERIFSAFETTFHGLTFTKELPSDEHIRFLDLELHLGRQHICWAYAPRSKKQLLPFSSAHSRTVTRAVALGAMKNALSRSCLQRYTAASMTSLSASRIVDSRNPSSQPSLKSWSETSSAQKKKNGLNSADRN
ncbi:hypothetical protein HPB52_003324 [Rhipicephalus sanguineus]|uniref:Reverse transcriptase domain-containing protein n=1 Tax=Rhipicephalus sanguineus TaxID=34632 RepID=A0A9D4SPZ6_RHISA|nr:hypothetical protein HPB52_003324 [Rhipicephalus sanguineus]